MREKQIEEMAKIIGDNTEQDTMWSEIYDCANALYNAGYRKASDVAREIFAEIYKALNNNFKTGLFKGTGFDHSNFITEVGKLNRKYTVTDTIMKNEAPTADVVEVRHGKNITQKHPVDEFICSERGFITRECCRYKIDEDADGDESLLEFEFRYCPCCGAKMDV